VPPMNSHHAIDDELVTGLRDICCALEGIGVELQAANTIARAVARDRLGEDPLEGTLYAADDPLSFATWKLGLPGWVNSGEAGSSAASGAAPQPEPKKCSDYASGQEVLSDELNAKLTRADKKSLDKDGDGLLAEAPGVKWKDTRTHVEGLPAFEVAFFSEGSIKGLKTADITVDVSRVEEGKPVEKMPAFMLTAVTNEVVRRYGAGSKLDYRAATFTYRDAKTFEEVGAISFCVADDEAAQILNEHVREEEGWKVDFFRGDVPEGGYVRAYTY
jgi:hypothetical protein